MKHGQEERGRSEVKLKGEERRGRRFREVEHPAGVREEAVTDGDEPPSL